MEPHCKWQCGFLEQKLKCHFIGQEVAFYSMQSLGQFWVNCLLSPSGGRNDKSNVLTSHLKERDRRICKCKNIIL